MHYEIANIKDKNQGKESIQIIKQLLGFKENGPDLGFKSFGIKSSPKSCSRRESLAPLINQEVLRPSLVRS